MTSWINYNGASVLTAENLSPRQQKILTVLLEEVAKRSRQQPSRIQGKVEWQNGEQPLIVLGTQALHPDYPAGKTTTLKPEGFCIFTLLLPRPVMVIHGADDRGLLYGIGKLLRMAKISPGKFMLPGDVDITESPRYAMRGHQLGYRPKTNAYDAWTEEIFDQYIRELALFGANSIEILPPRTDDDATGPHIKKDPLQMMASLSEIIDSYGLDVWIWYPNMGADYSKKETIDAELAEREEIFSRLKRIDAVFIPGGDPGDLMPDELFAWSEKVAALLHKYHPKAGLWLSPQAFIPSDDWLKAFYDNVNREPEWLAGLVHGPWIKTKIPEMRAMVPAKYPLRNYPDITHSINCQYFVPEWDLALAKSLARECINPRPTQEKQIHNLFAEYFVGSISYSEGINDDVNKFVWSGQDWNPDTPVIETLRDYARLFINPDRADDVAQGIIALERNFAHPTAINKEIFTCLRQWEAMEQEMPFVAMENYRFQMCLLRANYDAYIKRRLARETELELEALELLENTDPRNVHRDARHAVDILDRARTGPVGRKLRTKCATLADLLYVNIGSQLTVSRHSALEWIRGAFMDSIDTPLNDARYITDRLEKVLETKNQDEAFALLQREILNRTNPGPGGFYDSLGDSESWYRFPEQKAWKDDPGGTETVYKTFPIYLHLLDDKKDDMRGIPQAWQKTAAVLYTTPMKLRYDNLDPDAEYTVKIKYIAWRSDFLAKTVHLSANGEALDYDVAKMADHHPMVCFDLPKKITAGGTLILTWVTPYGDPTTSVAEVFLIKRAIDRSKGADPL